MPGQKTVLLLVLLILGAGLHLFKLCEPRNVVFDEVHFGGYVNAYLDTGEYYFDVHPPHAKLLIAGAAALGGYRGGQSFARLNEPITEVSPALLRLVPALAGTLIPLILFGFLLLLGASPAAAFLGGLAALLDNGLLLQTRIVALDGILLAATFGAISCALAAVRSNGLASRVGFALAAGAFAGLAAGTKFTGLAALAMIGLYLAVSVLKRPSWSRLRVAASTAVWILSAAIAVYAAGWYLHFQLLTEPGFGHRWAVPSGDFLFDTVRIHRRMLASNIGLTASHPYSSAWWSWPMMVRPVFYWSDAGSSIYFLGNPVLWWGSTLALLVVAANLVLLKITHLQLVPAKPAWPPLLWVPIAGYLISFVPLIPVPRALFLYHYLTPLLFGLCVVLLWFDHVGWTRPGRWRSQRLSVHLAVVALLAGFAAVSPFTFSFVNVPGYHEYVADLFPGWR